jgi:hypothetical protein
MYTLENKRDVSFGAWNYPWNEYTIGAVGNVLLLAVGLLAALCFPERGTASRHTLWDWLAAERQPHFHAIQLGDTP